MRIKILNFFSMACMLLVCFFANAEMAKGVGEYRYGPETSEAQACRLALDKAKSMALSSVMGEFITIEEQHFCRGTLGKESDEDCELNSLSWSFIEGDLKSTKVIQQKVEPSSGSYICTVAIEAEVLRPLKKPDPNFEVDLKVRQSIFRVGDDLTLEFESTIPAYFAIFNWLPNENNQINRVLLTSAADQSDSDFLKKNVNGKFQFKKAFTATWSKAYRGEKKSYDEWVLVVLTKKPYKWLSSYDFETFKEKLREIPNDERRIKRMGYQLSK